MKRAALTLAAFTFGALTHAALAPSAEAQTRMRRPFASETARVTAHFDTNGPGGGVADYTCGARTYDGHTGTDFGLVTGTPILASAAGTVINVFTGCPDTGYNCSPCGSLCGNQVRLRHADGSQTIYCHLQSAGMRVGVGDTVACGQVIAHSASSGCSTGPHLHFGWHASASSAADDPFSGACGGPISIWTQQRPYPQTPGTACACTPSAESCNGRDDDCDGRVDEGVTRACSTACGAGTESCSGGSFGACSARAPTAESCNGADDDCDGDTDEGDVCEVILLHEQPGAYAAPRFTDVNADGRADLCARGGSGVRCWIASPSGWTEPWAPIPWSDASGWDDVDNYATLRMGDVDGDGRADVCARANAGFLCALSTPDGFAAHTTWHAGISDAAGWDAARFYTTIRLADVNGDGRDDLCARDSEGFGCWLSDGERFDRRVDGPRWSDESGWRVAKLYGTIRMGDLDGDRRADVCGRTTSGMECWLSSGDGFPTVVEGPSWSGGDWGSMHLWSTIRMLDYDGDGRADLCAIVGATLDCARSDGAGFEAAVPIELGTGWVDRANYASLRVGDVNGDGADDLCARADAGVRCWAWDGAAFAAFAGPDWSDAASWDEPHYYQTIRLADFDGDGLEDMCGRAASGWRCHPSTGGGFGEPVVLDELTNAGNWDEPQYWSTILSAGRACRAEMEICNGRDDDCDSEIDEVVAEEICNGTDDDCDGAVDEHAVDEICNGVDDDCDGQADEGLACADVDGGAPPSRLDGGGPGDGGALSGGCGCRVGGARRGAGLVGLLGLGSLLAVARRRRRRG